MDEFNPTHNCCWNCTEYVDALCQISDRNDDENPMTFCCELYERDEWEN